MRILFTICLIILGSSLVKAQSKGVTFQAVVKDPSGNLVNASNIAVNAKIIAPNGCVLREESFTGVNITNGYLNLNLTKGSTTGYDPSLTVQQTFDNSVTRNSLTCIHLDGTVNGGVTSYTPAAGDARKLRVQFSVGVDTVIADFNIRSAPFAMNSETLNGVSDTGFLKVNNSQNLTQANAESVFNRFTKLDAILNNFNSGGTALSADITGNAATATNVSGTVAIANGGTGATAASGARANLGLGTLATMSPTGTADNTTYLRGDGTWQVVSGGVTSVAGQTGVVTLSHSDISGLGSLAILSTTGTPDGTKFLRDDGAWASVSTSDATKLPLAGGTMSGSINMGTYNITNATNISSTSVSAATGSFTNLRIYDGASNYLTQNYPAGGAAYTVQWPASVGTANQLLQITSVSGTTATLGWGTPASSGVSSVDKASTAGNPILVSGTSSDPKIDITKADASNNGYLSSADWTTFNGKQAGNAELTAIAGIALTGIIQKTGPGAYATLGVTAPINITGSNIGITQATTSASGYLSSTDWNTFNSKQTSLGFTPLNPTNNLSDIADVATSRTNLGLGAVATMSLSDINTAADARIAAQKAQLNGLASLDGSGKVPSAQLSLTATDIPNLDAAKITTGTITRDVSAANVSATNLRIYDGASQYLTFNLPTGGTGYTIKWPSTAGNNGDVLQVNGSGQLSWIAIPSAPVSSVAGRTGAVTLSSGDISGLANSATTDTTNASNISSGTLAYGRLPVGTGSSTVAAGDDARFTNSRAPSGSASGDLSGTYPSPTVAKIQNRAVDATLPLDGQVLLWDNGGTTWKAQYVRMQDVRNAWGGTQMIPSSACQSNESMVWSVVTDRFTCQAITGLASSAITGFNTDVDARITAQKAQTNGLATLDGSSRVPASQLGTGTADSTKFLRGDGSWQTPSTFGGAVNIAATPYTITSSDGGKAFYYTNAAAGTVNLPALSGVSDGFSVTISRQVHQALTVTPNGSDKFPGGVSTVEMRGLNLQSVTVMKLGLLWVLSNQTEDCKVVGQDCWTANSTGGMKQLYVGTMNGRQYFTTPGGCTNSATPTCAGGIDSVTKIWSSSATTTGSIAGNTATVMGTQDYGDDKVACSTCGGMRQSEYLATFTDAAAARYCEAMDYAGYTDWYLPTRQELNLLYQQSGAIKGFYYIGDYWSSTENYVNGAWGFGFYNGDVGNSGKDNAYYVRCVRSP